MGFEFAAAAIEEIDEALAYYRAVDPSLSSRMVIEIEDALQLIERFPLGWHPIDLDLRQRRLKSFPYVFVYSVAADAIQAIAFANTHRRPGYWRDRTSSS